MTPAVWKVQSETPLRKAQVRFYCQPCADEVVLGQRKDFVRAIPRGVDARQRD